jgi:TetR/AcrR family transcriptional repressor of nem operon
VKVTKEQTAANRETLLRTAGRLFREHGIDGVGVAEISKQAGLTHGALYAQFPSKEALAAEALAEGLRRGFARMTAAKASGELPGLGDYLDFYLSNRVRDDIGGSCPMAASASEIARQDEAIGARFTAGFTATVGAIEAALGDSPVDATRRERAIAITAAMIGGLAVARATQKSDPAFSDEIVAAMRKMTGLIGGEADASFTAEPSLPARG